MASWSCRWPVRQVSFVNRARPTKDIPAACSGEVHSCDFLLIPLVKDTDLQ